MRTFRPRRLFSVLRLSMLLCLLAGSITLLTQVGNIERSQANFTMPAVDPASVVGPPTLPAATVDSIFASVGSPMYGTGKVVEQAARQANIDDAFALGVWWVETNDGAAGVGSADRNPGSVKASSGFPIAFDGYTIYPSYSAAIFDWFNVLNSRYISRGLTNVYAISYPYVGTSSSPLWAGKVVALMQRYRAEAPPPPPIPTSLPKPLHPTISQNWPRKLSDQEREAAQPATLPTVRTIHTGQTAPASPAPPALALVTRDAIVFLGLLVALALALYALVLDGKLPLAHMPVHTRARQTAAVTTEALPFPSIFAIPGTPLTFSPTPEFSPALTPAFVSDELGNLQPSRQTETLISLVSSPLRFPLLSYTQETQKTPAIAEITTATISAVPTARSLRRFTRVTLQPTPTSEPHTTGLLSQASSLPIAADASGRVPVPASVSGLGLLSRYRKMQQHEESSL